MEVATGAKKGKRTRYKDRNDGKAMIGTEKESRFGS